MGALCLGVHIAWSAILPNGERLGLLPSEFDVTEWHLGCRLIVWCYTPVLMAYSTLPVGAVY